MIPRESVTLIRPAAVDIHGDPGAETTTVQAGCTVYPTGSGDPLLIGRAPTDAAMTVLGPPGWDVLTSDEMAVRGVRYRVVGLPFDWGPGVEVHLATRKG